MKKQFYMPKSRNNKGFSLVELSVSLAIIGMIVASALSVAITGDFDKKQNETIAKMTKIEEAMAGFLKTNLRLPCPADGTLALTNNNFGLEGTITPTGGRASCPNSNFTTGAPRHIEAGIVPIRTLQLPDDFMFDGWGRRISYAVGGDFINNETTNTNCDGATSTSCFMDHLPNNPESTIEISRGSGTTLGESAVYILLSHGQNGHGAFLKNGSATRINAFSETSNPYRDNSDDEIENSELDIDGSVLTFDHEFVAKPLIEDNDESSSTREYFDDILRFKTKRSLIAEAGAYIASGICRDAESIVNNPGSNACSGASEEPECESFATELFHLCLK